MAAAAAERETTAARDAMPPRAKLLSGEGHFVSMQGGAATAIHRSDNTNTREYIIARKE